MSSDETGSQLGR